MLNSSVLAVAVAAKEYEVLHRSGCYLCIQQSLEHRLCDVSRFEFHSQQQSYSENCSSPNYQKFLEIVFLCGQYSQQVNMKNPQNTLWASLRPCFDVVVIPLFCYTSRNHSNCAQTKRKRRTLYESEQEELVPHIKYLIHIKQEIMGQAYQACSRMVSNTTTCSSVFVLSMCVFVKQELLM